MESTLVRDVSAAPDRRRQRRLVPVSVPIPARARDAGPYRYRAHGRAAVGACERDTCRLAVEAKDHSERAGRKIWPKYASVSTPLDQLVNMDISGNGDDGHCILAKKTPANASRAAGKGSIGRIPRHRGRRQRRSTLALRQVCLRCNKPARRCALGRLARRFAWLRSHAASSKGMKNFCVGWAPATWQADRPGPEGKSVA